MTSFDHLTDIDPEEREGQRRKGYAFKTDPEIIAVLDRQPMVARCGLCPWTFEGTAGEAKIAQFEHRQTHALPAAGKGPKGSRGGRVEHRSQGLSAADRREAVSSMAAPKVWPRERIIEAMQDWYREHGQPPTASQWRTSDATHPAEAMVRAEFGSWAEAVTAAGLNGAPTGNGAHHPDPPPPAYLDPAEGSSVGGGERPAHRTDESTASVPASSPASTDSPHDPIRVVLAAPNGAHPDGSPDEKPSLVELARLVDECRDFLREAEKDYRAALAALAVAVSEEASA